MRSRLLWPPREADASASASSPALTSSRIAATGSPQELLSTNGSVEIRFRRNGETVVVRTDEPTRVLHELTSSALADGQELEALEVRQPTLEDVYLELTREEP